MIQQNMKFILSTPVRNVLCTILISVFFTLNNVHAAPNIEQWRTTNGVKTLFVAAPELPMLDIRIVFDAGSARDAGLPGLAALTNGLLAEGADGKSAQQLAESFESVGAVGT